MHTRVAIGLVAISAMALGACQDLKPVKGKGRGAAMMSSSGPKVKVEFYVMSKCPFGTQVEKGIKPVLDEIGDRVDFHLDFIANEKDGKFTALHGQPEVDGNITQLCAIKYHPNPRDYMKFVECQNKNMRQIPNNWEKCADQTGMDKAKMAACFKGEEGKNLLRESLKRAKDAKATGSPTIRLAGKPYSGGRSKNDFMRAICTAMEGAKPAPCAKIPEPVAVNVTVLTDARCKKCRVSGLEANLKSRFFPKLNVKKLDYATPEGKALYKEVGVKYLPIWLFDDTVQKAERYAMIKRWLMPKGKYKQLRVPANFDPTAEICDNKKDDTGNGKVDCDDETCKATLECREEIKNHVQVFVMSQCPFGVKAINAMKEVLDNFKNQIKFDVHFIADKTPTGFNALHGQSEVDENIRQLCSMKYYPKNYKYLDYFWCRNKNYRSNEWKPCAKEAKMDVAKLEKCATGTEGKKLLEDDIKIAKALSVSGSPTWLANNRYKFSGITAEQVKKNICQRNPGLKNCDKKLSAEQKGPAGSCGGS